MSRQSFLEFNSFIVLCLQNTVCFVGVADSNPTGGKLFAEINLPFPTKQYKNENIVNFV